jgi:RHS repeat-associated protein
MTFVLPHKEWFTGQERDSETNNDNFVARYFGSSLGRFLSPDPSGIFLGNPLDPQQLNLYAYTRNNPINLTDPTGLSCSAPESNDDFSSALTPSGVGNEDFSGFTQTECSFAGGSWTSDPPPPPPPIQVTAWGLSDFYSSLPGGFTGVPTGGLFNQTSQTGQPQTTGLSALSNRTRNPVSSCAAKAGGNFALRGGSDALGFVPGLGPA